MFLQLLTYVSLNCFLSYCVLEEQYLEQFFLITTCFGPERGDVGELVNIKLPDSRNTQT